MKKLLIALFLVSTNLYAQTLCERIERGIVSHLENPESRMSFKNQGGLFKGGVCWWHGRFQRSTAFLMEFKPDLARPNSEQVASIIRHIKLMDKVVVVPGFENFQSFSKVYQSEIQKTLEAWQAEDGFFNSQWIRGISGSSELAPDAMKIRMDKLFQQYQKSPHPIWVMAQIKGVESHSLLILEMTQNGNGYDLKAIDSNFPLISKAYEFYYGDKFLKHPKDDYSFVPYLGFQKDLELIGRSVKSFCGNIMFQDNSQIPRGEVEVSR